MSDDQTTPAVSAELFEGSPVGALADRMGIELVTVSKEQVVATMPVEGNTQPFGLLHGGASCVLAETVGSIASNIHGHPDRVAVGIEINATHHRAARRGTVTAVATPAHLGRSLATYEIIITDDKDRKICTARLTCMLVDRA